MSWVTLLRRAAGKPPSYIANRAAQELGHRLGARSLRRRLARLDSSAIARSAGFASLSDLWRARLAAPFLYAPGELASLRSEATGLPLAERAALAARFEDVLAHRFDLLGSGPTTLGSDLDWHRDFKSGRRWPTIPSHAIEYAELDQPSDVKVPWELSRCHHFVTLAQVWVACGERRAVDELEAQALSWIAANPPGYGVNWACTMEVALRAVNWIWALALMADAPIRSSTLEAMLTSLYAHGLWIPRHLEHGAVNGNHFLSDVLGLVACGAVFARTPDGADWLDNGVQLIEQEVRNQIGADGVGIEASVPYHRLVLELFLVGLRMMEAIGRTPSPEYRQRVASMIDFVAAYVTPDGLSPVIGDADDGRVLAFGQQDVRDHRYLLATGAVLMGRGDWKGRAGALGPETRWFLGAAACRRFDSLAVRAPSSEIVEAKTEAGFYVVRTATQYLFVDAGPVGFRGLGGHGHNDCLSFEWHAQSGPLLTDSGSYVYTSDFRQRNLFRSTAFHNTIRIDREELNRMPSELALWSLADDARPTEVSWDRTSDAIVLKAGHTGYRRLSDPVVVQRRFELSIDSATLAITDQLDGRLEHDVEMFFHAAPYAALGHVSTSEVEARWPNARVLRIRQTVGPPLAWELRAGAFSPSYGLRVPRGVWVARARVKLPAEIRFVLSAGES